MIKELFKEAHWKMIRIVSLVENTSVSPAYRSKHGLCLYVENEKHKILFDLGSNELFAENAVKMNIDITKIDMVVISHGHKDHGGALKKFLSLNSTAKVYIRRQAFDEHYIKVLKIPFSVGLDKELMNNKQIVFTDEKTVIDEELTLFSNVKSDKYFSKSNKVLYARKQGHIVRDDFEHEQSLIIKANGENILISGCSHAGIVNIQNKAEVIVNDKISTVLGGFHLVNPPTKKYESNELIDSVAIALNEKGSNYYTCHCTGEKAYDRMKLVLGDRLHYLATGAEVIL